MGGLYTKAIFEGVIYGEFPDGAIYETFCCMGGYIMFETSRYYFFRCPETVSFAEALARVGTIKSYIGLFVFLQPIWGGGLYSSGL